MDCTVDGGAISAGRAYNELTNKDRSHEADVLWCGFHTNNLASKEGLGVKKGKKNENVEMGTCLKKVHTLLTKMTTKSKFMKAYRECQEERGRDPIITIRTACETRADGWMVETEVIVVIFKMEHIDQI